MNTERPPQNSPSLGRDIDEPHASIPSRRALHSMAIVRWTLLGLVTMLAAYSVSTFWLPPHGEYAAHDEQHYYCPMHPQIRSPDPGECPICHMKLEPVPKERRQQNTPATLDTATSSTVTSQPSHVAAVTITKEKQLTVGISTSFAESATLGDRLRVPGVVNAPETGLAQVRVRAPGFVEQVNVRQTGVRVYRGQALAFVYSPEIYRAQEEYLAATRWSSATSDTDQEQRGTTNIATTARHALDLLGLSPTDIDEITRTGKPIRAIAIRSPTSGYVTRFNAVLGSRAEPEVALYEIADLSDVWVIASVFEQDVTTLTVGTTARFIATKNYAEPLNGRVDLIEPIVDESTRTTRIRLVVPNRGGHLRPGEFGEVLFDLPISTGLFIPRDAVIHTGEEEYVYVATSIDRFEPRLIRTGFSRNERIQVLAGVSEGERVVTRGSFMLDSESRLQTSLAAAPTPAAGSQKGSAAQGPSCETEFDKNQQADKYMQCRACEQQHVGMGSMVADCKDAIPKPWR